jgi:hypothetical protein
VPNSIAVPPSRTHAAYRLTVTRRGQTVTLRVHPEPLRGRGREVFGPERRKPYEGLFAYLSRYLTVISRLPPKSPFSDSAPEGSPPT